MHDTRFQPAWNLDWRLTVFPDENHNSVRTLSFPAGLRWVYRTGADAKKK